MMLTLRPTEQRKGATTTVSENVDFPVLVVNNSTEVDTLLWNFIAAMTNVKNGETAKKQVKDITATTYKWNSTSDTDDTNPNLCRSGQSQPYRKLKQENLYHSECL